MATRFLNRRTGMILMVLAALALASLACGGGTTPPTATPVPPTAPPPPTATPAQATTGGSGETVSLFVINESGLDLCALYVSPTTSDSWGDNHLGSDRITNNSTYELYDVPVGFYDMRVESCSDDQFAENYEADLTADYEWTLTPGDDASTSGFPVLTIVNNSNVSLCEVYYSLNTDFEWGLDRLESRLDPGESMTFPVDKGYGLYDIRAVQCDSTNWVEDYRVDFQDGTTYTWTITD